MGGRGSAPGAAWPTGACGPAPALLAGVERQPTPSAVAVTRTRNFTWNVKFDNSHRIHILRRRRAAKCPPEGATCLMDGRVQVDGIDLTYLNLLVEETFFRMLRNAEFDASEILADH